MHRFNALSFFICLSLSTALEAQISFTDKTSLVQSQGNSYSGIAVAIADMNGDGLDDVVKLNLGSELTIEYQTPGEAPFAHVSYGDLPGEAWAMAVADMNNDGYCDVMAGGYYDGVKVMSATDNGGNFSQQILPGAGIFVQGANFADINNDGWLDVFSCHDDGESRIWGNNGDGTFSEADDWIDMATTPPSDNSGNYGSVWTDFDNDRDIDLYIAKCRQGVDDPEDPRRINALFINDGDSHYTEAAGEYGLKIKWQSWTADFQDIDNDGDMDCLVTNHDYNLQVLENDGSGHFTDISAAAGISATGGFLQGIMRDFDNDGFVDILTAEPTYLFHNNGDKTFTQVTGVFGGSNLGTIAAGDLNNDGFQDIYAAYACGISNPCNVPDKLWMNDGNSNHFIGFSLQGNQSNRNGVGARLEIHGAWGIQIREVRSGESYGISNSLTQYFGIGQETEVEYVVVRWPSGVVDVVKNPAPDQISHLEEGSTCSLPAIELTTSGATVLCPGQSLEISAPAGFVYLWNNGLAGQSITVDVAGNYDLILVDSNGCAAISDVVHVTANPDETPAVAAAGDTEFCEGGAVVLTSTDAAGYTWSNGATSASITITQTGEYFVTVPGACGDFTSAPLHVEVLPAPVPVAQDIIINAPASVTLEAAGSHPVWFDSQAATVPVAEGNTFLTPVITETTTYYVEDRHEYGGGNFATGMPAHLGSNFNGNTFNGQVVFDAATDFLLKQVTVTTDQPGLRIFELMDANDAVLQTVSADLAVGETVVDLNFSVAAGAGYKLGTNGANNQAVLGTVSPRLYRSDEGVQYPYTVPDVVTISGSNFGSGFYYYFYNWQISVEPQVCISDRKPVAITLQPSAVYETFAFGKMNVQPNPSSGLFTLDFLPAASGPARLQVLALDGKIAYSEQIEVVANVANRRTLDLENIPAGTYLLHLTDGSNSARVRLVVQ